MISWHALECLGHLSNEQRFTIVKALISAGDKGLSLKDLERELDVSRGVVRRHVRHLVTCGMARTHREDRRVICTVQPQRIGDVIKFLVTELAPMLELADDHAQNNGQTPQLFSSLRDRLEALDGLDPAPNLRSDTQKLDEAGQNVSRPINRQRYRRPNRPQRLRRRRSLSDALSGFDDDL